MNTSSTPLERLNLAGTQIIVIYQLDFRVLLKKVVPSPLCTVRQDPEVVDVHYAEDHTCT